MTFRPKEIPAGMSMQQYAETCSLSQLIHTPLEITPRVRAKNFLSVNEIKFAAYLRQWLPNYLISTQVHLLQMIEIKESDIDATFMKNYDYVVGEDTSTNRSKAYWLVFNMVNLLSVDFVLTDLIGTPVYAIELDGPEHQVDPKLIERDKIKSHVLIAVGIPLLRVQNNELSGLSALETRVRSFAS